MTISISGEEQKMEKVSNRTDVNMQKLKENYESFKKKVFVF